MVVVVLVVVAAEVEVVVGAVVALVVGVIVVVDGAPSPVWQAARTRAVASKPPRSRSLMAGAYARGA